MSFALTQLCGFMAGERRAPTKTGVASAASGTNGSSFTFASLALGAANPTRNMFVVAHGEVNVGDMTGVTLDGNAMTEVASNGNTTNPLKFYKLPWPNNTTGTFVISFGASKQRAGIYVYSVITDDGQLLSYGTPQVDNSADGANTFSVAQNVTNGLVFGAAFHQGNSGLTFTSWGGLTEDGDFALEGGNRRLGVASAAYTQNIAGQALSATLSGAPIANAEFMTACFY